jgi:hypothetical protein
VGDVITDAREAVPGLHDIGIEGEENRERELHISLSRPTYLRAHQREDLKKAVKTLAKSHAPYAMRSRCESLQLTDNNIKTCYIQIQSILRSILRTFKR